MARLTSLTVSGLKASDRSLHLAARNLLLGPVGGGKTTIEDAVAFLALGYVPRLGKTPASTAKLLRTGCDRIEVSATLDDGRRVRRALVRSGKSLTEDVEASWVGVDENPSEHARAITDLFGATQAAAEQHVDVRALLSASPNERARHVSAMLDATGMPDEDVLTWARAMTTLRIVKAEVPVDMVKARRLADVHRETLEPVQVAALGDAEDRLATVLAQHGAEEGLARLKEAKSEAMAGARERSSARKQIEQSKIDAEASADSIPGLEKREAEARDRRGRAREKLEREERIGGERQGAQSLLSALEGQRPEVAERHEMAVKAVTEEIPALATSVQDWRERLAALADPPEIPAPAVFEPSPEALAEAKRIDAEAEALSQPSELIRGLDSKIADLERREQAIAFPEVVSTNPEVRAVQAAQTDVALANRSPWREVEEIASRVAAVYIQADHVTDDPARLRALAREHGGDIAAKEAALEDAKAQLAAARERAATVMAERDRLTVEQGRIRNDLLGAKRELAKAREDRQIEASAKRKAAAEVRDAAHRAAQAGNAAARADYESKAAARRKVVEENARTREDLSQRIAQAESRQRSIEAEGRAAQAAVDKLNADIAAAKAKLDGLAAGGCDIEAVRADFRAAEAELAGLLPKLEDARRQAARVKEMQRLLDEIEVWQARGVALTAAVWALEQVRAKDLEQRAGGLEGRMREFLVGAGRTEEPYLRTGKNLCEFGWIADGQEVAIEALSGGEFALFSTALAYAVTALRRPAVRLLLIEAAELGSAEPVYQLLRGLAAVDVDQALVATNASITPPDGWTVHECAGRARAPEGAVA